LTALENLICRNVEGKIAILGALLFNAGRINEPIIVDTVNDKQKSSGRSFKKISAMSGFTRIRPRRIPAV
jgi:hypothetical protein